LILFNATICAPASKNDLVIAELPAGGTCDADIEPRTPPFGALSLYRPSGGLKSDYLRLPPQSSPMTVHAPKLLTPEEFASLIEVAVTLPDPKIPAPHLAKLITLGYVTETAKGLIVTGDGLIRITESE
jgi:hypothetical protein